MVFTTELLGIVRKASNRHEGDLERSVARAIQDVRAAPQFLEWTQALIDYAIRQLVYQTRCVGNRNLKKSACGEPKVIVGRSAAVAEACASLSRFKIGSTILAWVLGKELEGLAVQEERLGDGHYLNARFLRRLLPLVPEEKRVEDVVSDKKLRQLFREEERRVRKDVA